MTNYLCLNRGSLLLAGVLTLAPTVSAQEPATPPPSAPSPAEAQLPDAALLPDTHPAVRAALELPRTEPSDYFQAVIWLIDLGRVDLARPILDELTQLPLTDEQRAALVDRFGTADLLKLARTKELAPAGGQSADAAMAAAAAAARDPARIRRLVADLTNPSPEVRYTARLDLAATGRVGVVATLEMLARAEDSRQSALLAAAAAGMEPLVNGPLLVMLDTGDANLRPIVARLLIHLEVPQAIPLLPADSASAEQVLREALTRYCHGSPPFPVDADDQIELWHWDDAAKKLSSARYPADEARVIWMARLARELRRLQPENRDYQRYALVLELEAAAFTATTPADALAAVDLAMLNDVLTEALASDSPHAAVAAIQELGRRGDTSVLHHAAPKRSPLANALLSPSRRVRFAALATIMALDPASPYPGSSRLPDALAYFADSTGESHAVVAMPTRARATDLAGELAAHGITARGYNNGRDAVNAALRDSDLELVLVDMNVIEPDVRQVVYELRIHPTTGNVPIAILAADGRLAAAERIAAEHERVIAVPRPHSTESLARIVERLRTLAGRDATTPQERAAQAVDATVWIAKLLAADRLFYVLQRTQPVLEAAAYQPQSNEAAFAALVELGTPESQQALVNFASQTTLPAASRVAAVAAFAESVRASGVLLTTDQILAQYHRYNTSADADADTRKVFGAILDAIESPRAANPPPPPWKVPPP